MRFRPTRNQEPGTYCAALFKRDMRRDLRRAAWFLWMMPLPAALSRAEMARTTASAESSLPVAICVCADFTYVLRAERTGLLRARLRAEERILLSADLIFAKCVCLRVWHCACCILAAGRYTGSILGQSNFGPVLDRKVDYIR